MTIPDIVSEIACKGVSLDLTNVEKIEKYDLYGIVDDLDISSKNTATVRIALNSVDEETLTGLANVLGSRLIVVI